jgi:sialic acid synthase SpsE
MSKNEITIKNKKIGDSYPVFIIAEAGVNHFGKMERAKKLVDMAVEGCTDAVKFQHFDVDEMISSESMEWKKKMGTKRMTIDEYKKIKEYCDKKGIIFLSSAHDIKSLEELSTLNLPAYKIGSGEKNNITYFRKVAKKNQPIILSTGMYDLSDINEAIAIFKEEGNTKIILLHCVTLYPTEPNEVNLNAIDTLKNKYNVPVGYSDHTKGYEMVLAAVAKGAKVIEKHIALEKKVEGSQDPLVSCVGSELKEMVRKIRNIEKGLGDGKIEPRERERESIKWATKSIVAKKNIPKGKKIEEEDITFKRPGTGIKPNKYIEVIGKKSKKYIKKDKVIFENMIE